MLHVISLSHSKLLETAPFDRLHIRVPSYIVTMAIFCIISEIKRNIGKKIAISYPSPHSTPSSVRGIHVGISP